MILHVDMDAFYASVEQIDNPNLQGKCLVVGNSSKRGVVAAASYEARKYGIYSAMPLFMAKKLCSDIVVVAPRKNRYKKVSISVMSLLKGFSPLVEQVSIDEAYVDITGCTRLFGSPGTIAVKIKNKIKKNTGLNCSIGVAPVKFLAKIASDLDKPDGLTMITPENFAEFIEFIPVTKVPGVGKKTKIILDQIGIKTLGSVRKFPEKMLVKKLGKFGQRLKQLSSGIDNSKVTPNCQRKSFSTETTLPKDTHSLNLIKRHLLLQSDIIGKDLRKSDNKAKVVILKIKYSDFKQVTRSVTLNMPTQSSNTLYKEAVKLLKSIKIYKKIRLVGIGASGLVLPTQPLQIELFSKNETRNWEKVEKTLDDISQKFGKNAVKRAALKNHQLSTR